MMNKMERDAYRAGRIAYWSGDGPTPPIATDMLGNAYEHDTAFFRRGWFDARDRIKAPWEK